jgi:hypothetical protein
MKTKIFFITVMFVAMISMASAGQNSIVDNIKLALKVDHNEFNVTNNTGHLKFGDMLKIQAKYDTDVEWYLDGQLVRKAKAVRTSWINPDLEMLPKQDPKNKVGYKAGRDPVTKKMRHLVELKYSEDKVRWVISE